MTERLHGGPPEPPGWDLPKIKFSHRYFKMPTNVEQRNTKVMQIFRDLVSNLSSYFLDYDTAHPDGHYKLSNGECIVILLETENHPGMPIIWTTIRSYNPAKYRYYKMLEGERVKIEIGDE